MSPPLNKLCLSLCQSSQPSQKIPLGEGLGEDNDSGGVSTWSGDGVNINNQDQGVVSTKKSGQ